MGLHLNLHNPRTRQRVLLAGAGLGLVVALLWARRSPTSTAQVGATTDPSALDPSGLASTSGVPSSLDGGGGVGATVSPTQDELAQAVSEGLAGVDWSALFQPLVDAFTGSAPDASVFDEAAPAASPYAYSAATLGTRGEGAAVGYVWPTGVPGIGTAVAVDARGNPTGSQLLGPSANAATVQNAAVSQLAASYSATRIAAAVRGTPTSGVAKSAPAPTPVYKPAPALTAPVPYKPQAAGVKVVAVTHPNATTTITHLSSGAVVEQVKGKTPYVVQKGR